MNDNAGDAWLQNSVSFDSALARLASLGSGTPPPPAASSSSGPAGFVKSSEEYSTTETTETKTFMYVCPSYLCCSSLLTQRLTPFLQQSENSQAQARQAI